MQCWPVEAVDGEHLAAFCDAYESGMPDADTQSALMHCILCALDDTLRREGAPSVATEMQADPIAGWLRADFDRYAKIIEYWRSGVDRTPDHGFAITPMMRRVWNDFHAPSYQDWQKREAERSAANSEQEEGTGSTKFSTTAMARIRGCKTPYLRPATTQAILPNIWNKWPKRFNIPF